MPCGSLRCIKRGSSILLLRTQLRIAFAIAVFKLYECFKLLTLVYSHTLHENMSNAVKKNRSTPAQQMSTCDAWSQEVTAVGEKVEFDLTNKK